MLQAKISAMFTGFLLIFQNAFTSVKPTWEKVAMLVPSSTSEETYAWLNDLPGMRKWVGERVLHALGQHGYSIKNEPFELTVQVKRSDVEDDKYGIYKPLVQQTADAAARLPDELVFSLLRDGFTAKCFDGKAFFAADHPNGKSSYSNYQSGSSTPWFLLCTDRPVKPLIFQERKKPEFVAITKANSETVMREGVYIYGVDSRCAVGYGLPQLAYASKADLTPENYAAARAAMMSRKNSEGKPLGIVPNLLVVPAGLEGKARKILQNEMVDGSTNEWKGTAEVFVSAYL